jgi:hypothetical protein
MFAVPLKLPPNNDTSGKELDSAVIFVSTNEPLDKRSTTGISHSVPSYTADDHSK